MSHRYCKNTSIIRYVFFTCYCYLPLCTYVQSYEIKCKSKLCPFPHSVAWDSQCNLILWIIRSSQNAFSTFAIKHFKTFVFCLCQWHWYLSFKCCSRATSRHDGIGGVSFHSVLLHLTFWNVRFLVAIYVFLCPK